MSNDGLRDRVAEVVAVVEEQLADIAVVREEQARLTAAGAAADGLVEVTVDVQGRVLKTVIDESYLKEYEFGDLAGHVTEAAQAAAREAGRRCMALLRPISERRKAIPGLSEFVDGAPDLRDLMPAWLDPFVEAGPSGVVDGGGDGGSVFPTVRS